MALSVYIVHLSAANVLLPQMTIVWFALMVIISSLLRPLPHHAELPVHPGITQTNLLPHVEVAT